MADLKATLTDIAKAIVDSHKGKIEVLCYNGLVEFKVKIPVL